MQSEAKHIYKQTSDRTGESEQEYKDIGNFIFNSLNSLLRRPPSLILKLKGVGAWYLRKKRMQIIIDVFPPDFDKTEFESKYGVLQQENKVELYNLFKDRLKDYEKYLQIRKEVRTKRYETQNLLEPIKREE